jgi:excisionase family DNA binding protein
MSSITSSSASKVERKGYRVNDFCEAVGIGRSKTYALIRAGKLRSVRIGGRRIIPSEEAESLLRDGA